MLFVQIPVSAMQVAADPVAADAVVKVELKT